MQAILTPRLKLRMFSEEDLDEYGEMMSDPEVARFTHGPPMNRAQAWRHMCMILGHWQLRGYGLWAAELRETGQFVGRIGCHYPECWPGFEVGWALHPKFWGKGLATEGAKASYDFAFNELKRDHIISVMLPENVRSIKVAERLGLQNEGKACAMGNEVLVYGISRSEWVKTPILTE